ncbi:MAG: Ig-like domain-containing protein [Candidatus Jorgensenbacteria bacterium]|nr:Ig-like domain-containing protein [Candidatus Jorgensenbacteria bacterium]
MRKLSLIFGFCITLFCLACGGGGGGTPAPPADTTAPTVVSVTPVSGSASVAINTAVVINFSESVDSSSVTTSSVKIANGSVVVVASIKTEGSRVTLTPSASLEYLTIYTGYVSGVKDLAGNVLSGGYTWSFTTVVRPDTTAPTVTDVSPRSGTTAVVASAKVMAAFSEAVNPSTVTTSSFKLLSGSSQVPATVSIDATGRIVTLTPTGQLAYTTVYTAVLTTAITDTAGNPLASNYAWAFTTGFMSGAFTIDSKYAFDCVTVDDVGNVWGFGTNFDKPWDLVLAKFGPAGNLLWIKTGAGRAYAGNAPTNIVTISGGYVYVPYGQWNSVTGETGATLVDKLSVDTGALIWTVEIHPVLVAESIAVDSSDNVYVASSWATKKFDSNGVLLKTSFGGTSCNLMYGWLLVAGTDTTTGNIVTQMDLNLTPVWREMGAANINLFFAKGISVGVGTFSVAALVIGLDGKWSNVVKGYSYENSVISPRWSLSLPEVAGTMGRATGSPDGFHYVVIGWPDNVVYKINSSGVIVWSMHPQTKLATPTTFIQYPVGIACGATTIFIADNSNVIKTYDPQTGLQK